jgi:hypothetical protein
VQTKEKGRTEETFWDRRPGGMVVVFTVEKGRKVKTSYENLPSGGVVQTRQVGSDQELSENGGLGVCRE